MSWDVYVYVFFLSHVKFLFAASIAEATTDLNFLEILLSSTLGALFCYNVSYLVGRFLFFKNNSTKYKVFFLKRAKKISRKEIEQ
jgi:membrane protein DedA with SNARE-associated domain